MASDLTVSVIVPARDAATTIHRTIDAALAQDYHGTIEIIVADGSTGDATKTGLAKYGNKVRVVHNPSGNTPAGLNAAIAAATGDVIVRCDAHAALPPGYVTRAVETLVATGAANVGGIQDASGVTAWERAVAAAQSTPLGVGDARYRLGGRAGPVDTVYLGVFRRAALERVGGFNPRFLRNQDYELNWRLREAGEVVWFDPALRVAYTPRSTPGSLARQYFDYGRWKRQMLKEHPKSLRLRQLAAPLLVIALVVSTGLALLEPLWGSVAPGIYLCATAVTAIVETVRRRDLAAIMTVVAIPIMHLAWGLGFLAGHDRS